jgi:MFS family permease
MSAEPEPGQSTDREAGSYPSPAYAWYTVVILTVAYMVSFIDRQIMALLVEPIRSDLNLSDTQLSWLIGLAFALFYTLLGLPIGRMADRHSRRNIIAIGITIWCVMTAACGLARNYAQLFLARVGVGVGEATLSPSALSLISDLFPREKRGRALTFYNMGISVGVGFANIVGGLIIAWVATAPPVNLPLVGELRPWQTVFLWVGLPGLVVAALMMTVREPARRDRLRLPGQTGSTEISIRETLAFLGRRWSTYGSHFLGMSVVTILGYGFFFWVPTMFVRTWDWTIPQISMAYGLVNLIFGPLGIVSSGWLADWLYRRGHKDGLMRVCLWSAFIFIPVSVLAPIMPTPELSLLMLAPVTVMGAAVTACGSSALMMITPNQLRAQTSALYYFVINLLGLTLGSSAVALVTDYVFGYDDALQYSLAVVGAVAGVLALGFLMVHLRFYRARLVEAEAWNDDRS